MEKAGKDLTRRTLLKGGAALGLTAMTGACASDKKAVPAAARAEPPVPPAYRGLAGWSGDDHRHAFEAFRIGCAKRGRGPMGLDLPPGWDAGCATRESARRFFEDAFVPVRLDRGEDGLFTGYYEPEILGSRFRHGPYQHPIHAKPARGRKRHSRADIMRGALAGQGLELFWLADPVDAFFLEIQGSGRIRLAEGGVARVGYAGQNGHRYYAIGRKLVEQGIATPEEISAEGLKAYLRANPVRAIKLMNLNPSYVFFREITDLDPAMGPIGAMGVPLTAGRSLAVDRHVHGLGLPVWVETTVAGQPWHRLMVAQDTGGAIKGPARGDIFFGTGDQAGQLASHQRAPGRSWTLVPRSLAPRIRPA